MPLGNSRLFWKVAGIKLHHLPVVMAGHHWYPEVLSQGSPLLCLLREAGPEQCMNQAENAFSFGDCRQGNSLERECHLRSFIAWLLHELLAQNTLNS